MRTQVKRDRAKLLYCVRVSNNSRVDLNGMWEWDVDGNVFRNGHHRHGLAAGGAGVMPDIIDFLDEANLRYRCVENLMERK